MLILFTQTEVEILQKLPGQLSICTSQRRPLNPAKQLQVKLLISWLHVPLLQGNARHAGTGQFFLQIYFRTIPETSNEPPPLTKAGLVVASVIINHEPSLSSDPLLIVIETMG